MLEEVSLAQRAGEKRFGSIVQLLELPKGELLVRFAYTTEGTARRGPVTLSAKDIHKLNGALEQAPRLREVLRETAS